MKKAVVFSTVTKSAYQDQLNAGFSKVCEIFKVRHRTFKICQRVIQLYRVCYCGNNVPRNVMLNETNCDLFVWHVSKTASWPWTMKSPMNSRPSAINLKVWLCETTVHLYTSMIPSTVCVMSVKWHRFLNI